MVHPFESDSFRQKILGISIPANAPGSNPGYVGAAPTSLANGKMRELVETSGLLNRQGVTAFKGSNPFLSAASKSQPLRGDAI